MRLGKFFLPLALALSTTTPSAQTRFFQRAGDDKSTDFGAALAGVGDVDADGFVDFAVGAPRDDGAGFDSGLVRVFSGYDGSELLTLRGTPADHFGFALAGAGDYDLDGFADVAVGSPEAHDGTLDDCGVVQVLDGTNGFELVRLTGASSHDNLGWSLASVGDLTGDGFAELAVGVPGDDGTANAAGRVSAHDLRAGVVAHSWLGGGSQDRFGTAVAGAGDVDRDGVQDVVVGVEYDDPNGSDSGAAYVLSGASGAQVFAWFGDAGGEKTGAAVAGLGDVNGDGYGEVAVGAPFAKDGGTARYGRVRVHSGKDGNALHTWFGDAADDRFGWAVSGVGDVDGDGFGDVAVGAPFDDDGGNRAGSVRVYSGRKGKELFTIHGEGKSVELGTRVANAGDVDDDGRDELFFGAPAASGEQGFAEVWSFATHPTASATHVGSGCGETSPGLVTLDDPLLGQPFTLRVDEAKPSAVAFLAYSVGFAVAPTSLGDGCEVHLSAIGPLLLGSNTVDTSGKAYFASALPEIPTFAGSEFAVQALVLPTASPLGFDLTGAVELTLGF